MNYNQKLFNLATKKLQLGNEKVIGCMKIVHMYNERGLTACLLTTEFEFILLEKLEHNGGLEVIERFFWDDVASVELKKGALCIQCDKLKENPLQICAQHPDKLAVEILEMVNKYKNGFSLTKKDPKINIRPPTALKGLQRFRMKLFKEKKSAPPSLIFGIESFIRHGNDTLDLPKLKCPLSLYNEILSFVSDMSNFSKIVLPSSLDDFSKLPLKEAETIKSLTISGPIKKEITLWKNISHIKEIVFDRSDISNESTFDSIFRQIEGTAINSLGFVKFCKEELYSRIFSKCSQAITSLSFKDMPNIPIHESTYTRLNSLSFINCNVFLKTEDINYFSNLTNITVDNGTCDFTQARPESMRLNRFNNITFTRVTWKNDSLSTFLNSCIFDKNSNISIDVSYAILDSTTQKDLGNKMLSIFSQDKNIKTLNWSGNILDDNVVNSLNSPNQSFQTIIIDNCSCNKIAGDLPALKLIKNNTKITSISLCGTDEHHFDAQTLEQVIEELKKNKFEKINLSGQFFGDGGLVKLADALVRNLGIKAVKYDGNITASFDGLNKFFSIVGQRGQPIDLEWPFVEIAKLRTKNDVPVTSINKLRQNYKIACAGGTKFEPLTDIEEEPEEYLPEDALNSYAEEFANQKRWEVELDPIPEPKNDSIIQEASTKYSIDELIKTLAQSN